MPWREWIAVSMFVVLLWPNHAAAQCKATSPCQLACKIGCAASNDLTKRELEEVNGPGMTWKPAAAAAATSTEPMESLIARVTEVAEQKFKVATEILTPQQYPVATLPGGVWEIKKAGHWMCGLFVGVMWQLYELTARQKQSWADKAQLWQQGLANRQRDASSQNDFGFIYQPSFAHSYAVTNSTEDKRQALAAAEALSWSFVPASKSIRTFEGWKTPASTDKYQQIVIIDFMINIQLLVWGSQNVGPTQDLRMDMNPQETWLNMAKEHARQVAANHVRPDGTTYHIVEYNPNTGGINKKYTYQGYGAESTWARGQAWAMAGFAMLYTSTGEEEFLAIAQKLTDKYLELLSRQPSKIAAATGGTETPGVAESAQQYAEYDRFIPQWDFDAPFHAEMDGPRDTSAAAVAALAMLHLAEAHPDSACRQRYLCAAVSTLRALASSKYLSRADETDFAALVKHATGGFPFNDHVDVGLISGDYYFLTALQKCATMDACRSNSA